MDTSRIKEHMMVHAKGAGSRQGAPRVLVGIVDHLDGEKYIKLTKKDSTDGRHHWIPIDWVESVDEQAVYLNKTLEEFRAGLIDEKPSLRHIRLR